MTAIPSVKGQHMIHIPGIHHVTAIAGDAQTNVDFYTGILQQRLVKKTVNFDAPDTYHLYYGDHTGSPGTILTFFPFPGATPGRAGPGMASAYAYTVPTAAFAGWADRAATFGSASITSRFGARVVTLRDPDDAPVELIEGATDAPVIGGFHSVTLWERDIAPTARLLQDVFGYVETAHETVDGTERLRLTAPGDALGNIVDIIRTPRVVQARPGAGTIHHVAFRARNDDEQLAWIDRLASAGHRTTPVIDRQYFNAIYFREPGGVLFEIATDAPGFAVDEPVETLGQSLKLPAQHEALRAELTRVLPPLRVA
jgi:glyoxalase family protein